MVFDGAIPDHFLGPYDLFARTPQIRQPSPGRPACRPGCDLTARLTRLPAVSIAVIRGATRRVGNEFALACDLRFASVELASIDQPEVHAGFVPGGGAIARLPPLIGRARTLEVVLGSQTLRRPDRRAVRTRRPAALPDGELDGFVDALASNIADAPQYALIHAKALVDQATLPSTEELVAAYEAFFASVALRAG